ncbi:thiamine biosynthesis protein ThiI [Desulfitispora alkaliphila]|uniref:tRNA uracil 4-sulfurtransferase ThiI n=1 Tax=Desulfitispora alkaliphila TaxID=622674 RepID=UPI003D1D6567
MYDVVLIRYGEIGIKGKNRGEFEKKLINNINKVLHSNGVETKVQKTFGRMFVPLDNNWEVVKESLQRVFGIVSFSPCFKLPLDIEKAKEAALNDIKGCEGKTFKVNTKRANKDFEYKTYDVNHLIGSHILRNTEDLTVDVKNPDINISVEIRDENIFLFSKTIPAAGGLPVGTNGKGLLLLSGGIDSPVAGYLTMKRGVQIEAIHFHSFPFTSDRAKEKVLDLGRIMAGYGGKVKLHIVHFTEIQTEIKKHCPEDLGITIMRRMMVRIAERLARKRRALALVTGESIGQVASQTLESMFTIENVIKIPVLRPLVAMDKTEIIDLAREIGTYETSILPYEDCCTIFVPKSPKTRPRVVQAESAEEGLDIEALIEKAMENIETIDLFKNR